MTQTPNDGGPAFPGQAHRMMSVAADGTFSPLDFEGMTLRDWFATHAPRPSDDRILLQVQIDKSRNPHNDSYKPKLRSEDEIIADLAYEFADAMLAARSK